MRKEFKLYKLKVTSDSFIKRYDIKASSLTEASKQARIRFGKDFNQVGSNVKVSLDPSDLENHFQEIIRALML